MTKLSVKWYDINITIDKNKENHNSWEYIDWEIYLYKRNILDSEYRETIIHELLHAILDKYYYVNTSSPIFSKEIEEQIVNIISSELDKNRDGINAIYKILKK